MTDDDRAELERLVGAPIVATEHAPAGTMNRTDLVTLADGRRIAVQRYRHPAMAVHRLRIVDALGPGLRECGIPAPRLIRADLDAVPPFALFDPLPGTPMPVVDDLDGGSPEQDAALIGSLLPRLRSVRTDGLDLPDTWSDPHRLAAASQTNLDAVASFLEPDDRSAIGAVIDRAPDWFAGRPSVLAHGDLAPQNILVDAGRISGVLDWEFCRLADPLFDVAWWAWPIARHSPDALRRRWPAFLQAAEVVPSEPFLDDRIRVLWILRVLEIAAHAVTRGPETGTTWVRNLADTVRLRLM